MTELDLIAELRKPAPALPAACRLALLRSARMSGCIHIERMMHRSSIAVSGESVAGYTLVKLIPSGLADIVKPLALNLAVALDVSGSMYEEDGTGQSRLERVQKAAIAAIGKLAPQDTLAIIAFAHNALVLLPPTPIAEGEKIEDILRRIDRFDVDPGGTAMDEGLALAMHAIEEHSRPGTLSQVVVLTDGETSGEQNCRELAREAAARSMRLTLMGVGLDWKASLLKELASLSQGKWCYIDVAEAEEATRIFAEEFETLAATAFTDVEMRLRPMKDVQIKRARQVVPEIKDVPLHEVGERELVARLGALQQGVSPRYILDVNFPPRPDGKYAIAQLELSYDIGTGQRETSAPFPLEMTYTAAGHGYVNAEVMKHIDEVNLKALNDELQSALQKNDRETAQQVAEEMVKQGSLMGPAGKKKTLLVKQVLDELNVGGVVPRQTQLKLDDEVRNSEVPG